MRVPAMVFLYDGIATANITPMMATVTSSSINVNPVALRRMLIP
jgi:hypothetical protein